MSHQLCEEEDDAKEMPERCADDINDVSSGNLVTGRLSPRALAS